MKDSGTYVLVIASLVRLRLRIGKLGIYNFRHGYYVYVGSALGGLSGRLRHHLRPKKSLHWHIDYLLQQAAVTQIWYAMGPDRLECEWNTILQGITGATPWAPGFGASDCRCFSHLTNFQKPPHFELFKQKLKQIEPVLIHRLDNLSEYLARQMQPGPSSFVLTGKK